MLFHYINVMYITSHIHRIDTINRNKKIVRSFMTYYITYVHVICNIRYIFRCYDNPKLRNDNNKSYAYKTVFMPSERQFLQGSLYVHLKENKMSFQNFTSRYTCCSWELIVRHRVLMLEAYGSVEQIMGYYGTPSAPGGHFPFNFRLISDIDKSSSAEDFSRVINEYLERMTDGRTANWVVSKGTSSRICTTHRLEHLKFHCV